MLNMVEEIVNTSNKLKVLFYSNLSFLCFILYRYLLKKFNDQYFRIEQPDRDQFIFGMYWMYKNGYADIAVIIINHTMKSFYM